MTNDPNSGNQPETNRSNQRLWLLMLSRTGIGLGVFVLVGAIGGVWWLWVFVSKQLAPQVESNLSQILNRPVQLGKVESFSLNNLRFGASAIPPTATDPDTVSMQSVDVSFEPISFLLTRTLHLHIKIVKPNVYIEQDANGRWVSTKIETQEGKGPIKTKLESLTIQDADIALLPYQEPVSRGTQEGGNTGTQGRGDAKTQGKLDGNNNQQSTVNRQPSTVNRQPSTVNSQPSTASQNQLPTFQLPLQNRVPVVFTKVNGMGRFLDDNQRITFDFTGSTTTGANLKISGAHVPSTQKTDLAVDGKNLIAADVSRLIKLPLELQAGVLDANLTTQLIGGQEQPPAISGTVRLYNVTAKTAGLPKPLANTNGVLNFKEFLIGLENISTFYGQIPLQAAGAINTQSGYNISARTAPVGLKSLVDTFDINLPPSFEVLQPQVQARQGNGLRVSGVGESSQNSSGNLQSPVANLQTPAPLPIPNSGQGTRTTTNQLPQQQSTVTSQQSKIQNPKSKIQLAGEVQAELKVVGSLRQPIISGTAVATKPTRIDRLSLKSLNLGFQLVGSTLSFTGIKALPAVGGQIDGSGVVKLGKPGNVVFEAIAKNLPGDTIATTYGIKSPITIGAVSGKATLAGPFGNFQTTVRWQAPNATYPGTGEVVFSPDGKTLLRDTTVKVAGGTVSGGGQVLSDGRWQAALTLAGVQPKLLSPNVPAQFQAPISGKFNLSGNLSSLESTSVRAVGSGSTTVAGGKVSANKVQLNQGRFRADVNTSNVQIQRLAKVPPTFQGPIAGNFNVSGNLDNYKPSDIRVTGSGSINIAGGTIKANSLKVTQDRWQGNFNVSGIQVQRLTKVPPSLQGILNGNFNLSGLTNSFQPETFNGRGQGSLNLRGGKVNVRDLQLFNGRWKANLQTRGLQVNRLAQVPPQLQGSLTAGLNLSGSLTNFQPEAIAGSGAANLQLAKGGSIAAKNILVANGLWQTDLQASGVRLRQFNQNLDGRLAGALNVSGKVSALDPANVIAAGRLNFSEGISLIDRPLTATVAWDGQKLQIQQATAQGFEASGLIYANLQGANAPQITNINLNVRANDLNLAGLPATLPNNVKVAGRLDFDGQITGSLTALNITGEIPQLTNLAINGFKFEPVLSGRVQLAANRESSLQLSGSQDRIDVALAPGFKPESFYIQTQGAVAQGRRQGNNLLAEVRNFPLTILKTLAANTPIAKQPIGGLLSGNFAVNLNDYSIAGNNIAIAKPKFNNIRGDLLTGNFTYANGVGRLTDAEFLQGESKYALSGNFRQTPQGPQFQAQVKVELGKVQDVLTALQIFDIQDLSRGTRPPTYAKAAAVEPLSPVGLPASPLLSQLRRFSEIQALIAQQQQQRREASPIPELRDLQGTFSGEIIAKGSPQQGIEAEFNLDGQNWQWGINKPGERFYTFDQVIARGSFKNDIITLLPLSIQSGQSIVAYSGTVGGREQNGQLRVQNVPATLVRQFVDLPIDVTGQFNATANIAGSIENPQARGVIALTEGTLNQTPVQSAQSSFSYTDARLIFSTTVIVDNPEPITINGSLPYKLPFASVKPDNNRLTVNVDLKDKGLALLNLLSRQQIAWVDGSGQVQLKVDGTINPDTNTVEGLIADGSATVANATIKAQALPEPLTNVNGKVLFDLDQIRIDSTAGLQAQFSGGKVSVTGAIPITSPQAITEPLTVNIGELALNLKGLYNGGVAGNVVITGSALAPTISGQVQLFNGQVLLAEKTQQSGTGGTGGTGGDEGVTGATAFNNLRLRLGRNVQVTRPPILNFLATGSLTINGSLEEIRPSGTIRLRRGQVNLFTTQFRLARGYRQTARFFPNQGLDPTLDVRLVASVPEVVRNRLPTSPTSSEIADDSIIPATNLGALETIRIQARVTGPASQLADNLELTSNPPRTETEIVGLLGGGFVSTLGRGDSTLGLANLAGSAILGNFQSLIGNSLGAAEFRLFPTIVPSDKRERTSTLALGAEVGVDITRRLSASVITLLTGDPAPQYNLRYRVNDKILLRGSTDFTGESRAIVEYEDRF